MGAMVAISGALQCSGFSVVENHVSNSRGTTANSSGQVQPKSKTIPEKGAEINCHW